MPSPADAARGSEPPAPGSRHSHLDDALALGTGTLLFALSIAIVQEAGLLTGGTSGIALLGHYATGIAFGRVLFVLNLPFYLLAAAKLGGRFTIRTVVVVALVSGFSELMPRLLRFERLDPLFAAVAGGLLAGISLLILFRHGASLGGIGVVALTLHDRFGWRVGFVQLAIDGAILLASLAIASPRRVALSVVGMLAFNLTIAVNHRPGRYLVAIP
jgi:uncharacterized membrane-anchored protein YitT (DUF2179 family)